MLIADATQPRISEGPLHNLAMSWYGKKVLIYVAKLNEFILCSPILHHNTCTKFINYTPKKVGKYQLSDSVLDK